MRDMCVKISLGWPSQPSKPHFLCPEPQPASSCLPATAVLASLTSSPWCVVYLSGSGVSALWEPPCYQSDSCPGELHLLRDQVSEQLQLLGYDGFNQKRPLFPLPPSDTNCLCEADWKMWRRLLPPRVGRPRNKPRPRDQRIIAYLKQVDPDTCFLLTILPFYNLSRCFISSVIYSSVLPVHLYSCFSSSVSFSVPFPVLFVDPSVSSSPCPLFVLSCLPVSCSCIH